MEAWANRTFVDGSTILFATVNGHAMGLCEAYQKIINVEATDLFGDSDEE